MDHTLNVTGMTCGHCEKAVTQAIRQLDPSAEVHIARQDNRVEVKSTLSREAVSHAIEEAGYAVAP